MIRAAGYAIIVLGLLLTPRIRITTHIPPTAIC
jgi:hypothetical protein